MKEGQPWLPHVISVGGSDEDLNSCDGHMPEGSNNDVMNVIKDHITSLIRKWVLMNSVVLWLIVTEGAGADVSKFKHGLFPQTTLLNILGCQGLVVCRWPYPVLMPGQLCKSNTRTKGIADLSHADQHHLHTALTDREISVTKVQSKCEWSKCLQYVHNSVLMCGLLSETLGNSKLPEATQGRHQGQTTTQRLWGKGRDSTWLTWA